MRDKRLAAIADQLLEIAAELDAISVRGTRVAAAIDTVPPVEEVPDITPRTARRRNRCRATNTSGRLCEHKAIKGTHYCYNHSAHHRTCTGKRVNGEPCNALPMTDREVCAYHAGLVTPPSQKGRTRRSGLR